MKYYAIYPTLGTREKLELTSDRVSESLRAKDQMDSIAGIEEVFDILIENYFEYEKTALSVSLGESIFSLTTMESMFTIQRQINRALANLLSSVRMYLDQVSSILAEQIPDIAGTFKELRSLSYDSSLSFRIMESLRNTTQHKALPFGLTVNTNKKDAEGQFRLVFSFSIDLLVRELERDSKFKFSVLEEVRALDPKTLSLNAHIRSYVDELATIHQKLRTAVDTLFHQSEEVLTKLFAEYSAVNPAYSGDFQNYLGLFETTANGFLEIGQINDISLRNARYIRGRLATLTNLGKRVVTNDFK